MLKLIKNNHYHVWTDALHARALAHQAANRWDRGTYVRWTIVTAWIALEIACQDALNEPRISYSFRQNLDRALEANCFPKLEWSTGIWRGVLQAQQYRVNCMHRFTRENDLFPDPTLADETVAIIRRAIIDIYNHVSRDIPHWVNDASDKGWADRRGFRGPSDAYHVPAGLDEHAPDTIRITYSYKDGENTWAVLPSGTDPEPYIDRLIATLRLPVLGIKAYRGQEVIQERRFPMDKIRGT